MRFRKGSRVEVWCKHEVPSGSWRCAEIVCSNKYYVTVRHDTCAVGQQILEKVPRSLVRSCPPVVDGPENWSTGDVIEVLHNFSWKMATVLKAFLENQYAVRLVGLSDEFKVHKVDTRLRQSWLDGKWVLVGQGSGSDKELECNESRNYYQLSSSQVKRLKIKLDSPEEKDYVTSYKRNNFQESNIVSLKSRKRESPYCYPFGTTHHGVWRSWLSEKEGGYDQVAALDTSPVPEKNDDCMNTINMLGQYDMCFIVENRKTYLPEKNVKRMRMLGMDQCPGRRPEHNDSDASSVGSCSITGSNPLKWYPKISGCLSDDAHDHSSYPDESSSDAESSLQLHNEDGNYLVSSKELAAEIHRLELNAYRCTMEALHASGPLSWEQESVITNLRISLHISNDEHLMELRHLNT